MTINCVNKTILTTEWLEFFSTLRKNKSRWNSFLQKESDKLGSSFTDEVNFTCFNSFVGKEGFVDETYLYNFDTGTFPVKNGDVFKINGLVCLNQKMLTCSGAAKDCYTKTSLEEQANRRFFNRKKGDVFC